MLVKAETPVGIDVHDYTIEALDKAKHIGEIETCDETVVHIDAKHSGVGSNSCGEEQLYANKTRINDYELKLWISCVENSRLTEESKKVREWKMNKKSFINQKNIAYILIAPIVVIFLIFMVYPILRSLYLSFLSWFQDLMNLSD